MARIADGSFHVDVEATDGLEDIKTALDHASREARSGKVLITPNGPLVCLLLIPSAAESLGFPINVSQCEQSVRVR